MSFQSNSSSKQSCLRPPQEPNDDASPCLTLDSLSTTTTTTSISTSCSSNNNNKTTSLTSVGCAKTYADQRTMTRFQEKINALTILPSGVFCVYYLWTGQWIRPETVEWALELARITTSTTARTKNYVTGIADCTTSGTFFFPYPPPPPTILAICLGILIHCPCSFLYHWQYAANPDATARFQHWSRRLDHSAIHFCSIFWAYGLSGSPCGPTSSRHEDTTTTTTTFRDTHHVLWSCFVAVNVLYNIDSIRCHWEKEIQPRRNQLRILISMLLYTSPLLWQEPNLVVFGQVWVLFAVALWFFAAYPIGGWSHAAFHVIMVGVPPILLDRVAILEASSVWSRAAAQCVAGTMPQNAVS